MRTALRSTVSGVVAVAALALSPTAALALPPQGGLTQLPPPNDCIQGAAGTCGVTTAKAFDFLGDLAVSLDGKNVYATSFLDDAVAELNINASRGLGQLADPDECISDDPDGGGGMPPTEAACQSGAGLKGAEGVAVSPDGLSVYVVSVTDSAVSAFSRNPATGALTQLPDPYECLSDDADGPGMVNMPTDPACGSAVGLGQAADVAVSPDGANVYVASGSSTVASFARDTTPAGPPVGSLTQLAGADGCVTQTGFGTSCTTVFPSQSIGRGIVSPRGIDVTGDGGNVYVASFNGDSVAAFTRNNDGSIDQLADPDDCLSDDPDGPGGSPPTDPLCAGAFGLNGAEALDAAPDGDAVYTASFAGDSVAALKRNGSTGVLTQIADPDDCLSFDSDFIGPSQSNGGTLPTDTNCASATGLDIASGVAAAPDDKGVYTAATGGTGGGIAELSRNQSSEELNQLNDPFDCVGASITNCAAATNLIGVRAVALSPDGGGLYAIAPGSAAIVAFSRELPPICSSGSATVVRDTATPVGLSCTDVNGDPLDRSILTPPAHGALTGDPDTGSVVYTPAAGYTGPDSFVFNAEDLPAPGQPSGIATISIDVVAPQSPPTTTTTTPPVTTTRKKCKKHRKLRHGKCVKKKRK